MLPTHFTCAELIIYCGGDPTWAKDPRLTGAISTILKSEGYTQRMVHHKGQVERQWSRRWTTVAKRVKKRMDAEGDEKMALVERIRMIVGSR